MNTDERLNAYFEFHPVPAPKLDLSALAKKIQETRTRRQLACLSLASLLWSIAASFLAYKGWSLLRAAKEFFSLAMPEFLQTPFLQEHGAMLFGLLGIGALASFGLLGAAVGCEFLQKKNKY